MSFGTGRRESDLNHLHSFINLRDTSRNKSSDRNDFNVAVSTLMSLEKEDPV